MATINVKDAAGSTVALEKPLIPGQAAMAASRPVVIASDQSALPVASHAVTNAGTFAVQNNAAIPAGTNLIGKADVQFAGTVPDTGPGTGGTKTQRVIMDNSQLGTLGQTTMSASVPMTLASDQTWPVGTTGFMKKEDVASADGDAGVAMLAVRKATPVNTSGTDGDYEFMQISGGATWVATAATDKTLVSERVIAGGSQYETVAVSQSDQVLGATGATGDYLESLICVVATAATSQVQIKDGAGSAITVLPNAVGAGVGTYILPVGLISLAGAWKVTTAAGVTVIGTGRFT